jgi:DNA-binding IclR family transcriptional regulator
MTHPSHKPAAAPRSPAARKVTAVKADGGKPRLQLGAVTPPSGVLERGIAVLECFTEERLRLPLRAIAEITGLDKATLLRLLGVLVRARLVHRFDDSSYSPGPSLLHLGMLYRRTFDIGSRLQPALREVMLQTGETVAFYVRSGDERVCLYRENSSNEVRHHVEIGTRIKLAAGGSSAHVLKAFTGGNTPQAQHIRTEGFALTRGERIAQMASVALPVFESDGSFLGALVVIGLAPRQSATAQRKAVQAARRALAAQGFAHRPPKDWQAP